MGVVIEICIKHPGGPTRMTVTDIITQHWYYLMPARFTFYAKGDPIFRVLRDGPQILEFRAPKTPPLKFKSPGGQKKFGC